MPLEEQIINQSNNEVHALSDSLNSLQENQVKQQEQINIQEINTDDQIQITQNFGRIMQDMIPESDEDIIIQDPQEEEGKSLATQTSQIEEDIKFNNEDEQQYNVEVTQQKVLNDKQENQTTKTQENKKIEQEEQSNVQEITQELTQAKREIPEDQLQQIVTSEEKNVNENQVTRTINNPFEDDGLKLSSEVIQDKCIIIYSQCEYQGFALEVCDSLKDIEKFKHKIKSIYIPQGYGLTIFQNQNFNGQSHRYTSSQRCLEREVSFIQLQIDQTILLKHQNLRGQN
ncbi:unnamed protein product [Paramecium sonneborni]|nr:unnamed protein product [Paramecium sonneborni]